jgi:hypothetical protein
VVRRAVSGSSGVRVRAAIPQVITTITATIEPTATQRRLQ